MKWNIHRFALRILGWPFRMVGRLSRKTDGGFGKLASSTEEMGVFRFLRSLEAVAIVATISAFWVGWGDRQADRDNRAWSLIASVSGVEDIGNIGVGNALEILKNDGVALDEIHLPGVWLWGADLSGASLRQADLSGAVLSFANLSEAKLWDADFSGADIWRANLSGADLTDTDLRTAEGLIQAQIDSACYIKILGEVILPAGFRQPPECPEADEIRNRGKES